MCTECIHSTGVWTSLESGLSKIHVPTEGAHFAVVGRGEASELECNDGVVTRSRPHGHGTTAAISTFEDEDAD